ncbi:hypothetical protein F7731_10505 [Cytobacillus depressus]|uniref:Yip1 domain-containing protein n=1 Tax=Cytobacillus depressus TaxID=1602942 RepID=A0A6L3V6A9_9BACI|nr:hypothetical protein [Cytobacillus depressus]KAB2336774.1 hypothetical protein F7731_10505 [Cytobacillus depressus]
MFYKLRLVKGIVYPSYLNYQLSQAEKIQGLWKRIILLICSSGFLALLTAFFGIGNEILSKDLLTLPSSDFESIKLLFAFGKTLWGLLFAVFMLFLPALFFWTVTEIPYTKLLSTQTFILFILLIGKAVHLLFALLLGIDLFSSPLSLGVIIQYVTNNELLITLFGSISVFHIWAIYLQYTYIKKMTEKEPRVIFSLVMVAYLFLLIISTLLHYTNIEGLL